MPSGSRTAQEIRDVAWAEGSIVGDPQRRVQRACALNAVGTQSVSFMSRVPVESDLAASADRYVDVTLFCVEEAAETLTQLPDTTLIVVPNPRLAFMRAVAHFFAEDRPPAGIHPTAVIDPTAIIDDRAAIGPSCFVGPYCRVGPHTVLGPNVALMQSVTIGARVTIAGGTVIGADGFGYERNETGELEKFPHIGGVVIADDVEIGSNTSVDRGTLNPTMIGARARIDNQVHIAHNVVVGEDAAIIAQAMIGGSVKIGARAWIAPSATIMNQVSIGADATVGLGAVVVKSVADGTTVMGSPAQPDVDFRRTRAALKRLADDFE